jgi:hypothetical protein
MPKQSDIAAGMLEKHLVSHSCADEPHRKKNFACKLILYIYGEKMVKGGCWDFPAFIVGCYGFYVLVQCFFLIFDVLCGGVFGTILPLTFT